MSTIETLPVEILHRIFDNLDTQTILLSIRPVCRLFRSIVNTYNRYILNFKLMEKSNFFLLCRLINPENVISLTLSDDQETSNQIALFLSMVCLSKLTRLRSLTLLNINECELEIILKHIDLNHLTSFSFNILEEDDLQRETTTEILSSVIEKSSLYKFEFDLDDNRLSKIAWPINCTIQYLTINNHISIRSLCKILQYCPHLHTLIAKIICDRTLDDIIATSFQQLTSLTIDEFCGTFDQLEPLLLLTPSLIYLKIIDGAQMLNGKRWEQLIQVYLPHLNKFEFFFGECNMVKTASADIELIIASFQTPFWLEHKKWFVIGEYSSNDNYICLYSIPICLSEVMYEPEYKKLSLPTCHKTVEDDLTIMNNVKSLAVLLNQSLADDIQEKVCSILPNLNMSMLDFYQKTTTKVPLFPKVTEIDIGIENEWPLRSIQLLSILIDFSQIVQLFLNVDYDKKRREQTLLGLNAFLQQAHNLSSLFIESYSYKSSQTIDNLCVIIPHRVKHLEMPVRSLKHIKRIIERCENLSTVRFNVNENSKFSKEVIKWFADNTINSTCSIIYGKVNVWLGKKNIQPTEIRLDNKRLKLTDIYCSDHF